MKHDYDFIVIGSGFGGAVSALRLSEKGYKVLVIEKGKWFKTDDFPKTNWNIRKWIWWPQMGLRGFFKMTFLNHVTVLSGVGVGGGSLTYANTLPKPKEKFYKSGSWANLADWQHELREHYETAWKMLGASNNPSYFSADHAVKNLAGENKHNFKPAKVSVYFGEKDVKVSDPYFGGKGPDRKGCLHCGACMTGCRHHAKNTLDKNYLFLAQQLGAKILAETKVVDVHDIEMSNGRNGYVVKAINTFGLIKRKKQFSANGIVFAGGVLGTVPLLLKLKNKNLRNLSDMIGKNIRTNNEALTIVTSVAKEHPDYTKGIAIGSILHADEHSHLEPTRFGPGSGFFKLLSVPSYHHPVFLKRITGLFRTFASRPAGYLKAWLSSDYSERSTILLFMQSLDSTLRMKRGKFTWLKTEKEEGDIPTAFIPESENLTNEYKKIVDGVAFSNVIEVLRNTPTTAHILGGCVMGKSAKTGVIDQCNRVFGYENMYVCDGSMISANPGVNPSLSITAITERAMSKLPKKPKS